MSLLRSVAEHVSRNLRWKRQLPAQYGGAQFYVSPDCGLRYWRRRLWQADPLLLNLARIYVKPRTCVWDIGANLGLFTFAALGLGAYAVVAVEQDPWLVALLQRSNSLQPNQAEIIAAAVAEACGERTFNVAKRSRSANFLSGAGSTQTGGVRESFTVSCVTLDSLLPNRRAPDILKIDVEGAENLVLRGASLVLSYRPVVIVEVAGENAEEVGRILKLHDYHLHHGETGERIKVPVYQTVALPAA